jgi:ubiquinone/menaquinone biosynthesis C-methylase UbiE
MNNNSKWNNKKIIKWYLSRKHIQNGEKKILELVDFSNIKTMLDIGVGGGRTSIYFLNLVESYLGIDIISDFIDSLQKKYSQKQFKCMNVLDITNLEKTFDFILFSHNGIDNLLTLEKYTKTLDNMYKVCNKNGYVCFSSHNIWKLNKNNDFILQKCDVVGTSMKQVNTNPLFLIQLLRKNNYSSIIIIDRDGEIIDINKEKTKSGWLYYLCKK